MKGINTILLAFMLFYSTASGIAQSDSSFLLLKTIKGSYSGFNVDNLDNIYLISTGNQLKKITGNGDSAGVFNDVKRFGKVSSIDVTNPLKILLFYKHFGTLVVLDRFLNTRNTINFRKQNIFFVNSIATSYDNNIWLFDEQDYKLKKIDDNGQQMQETTDFRMLFDSVPSPVQITDNENFVYLYDPEKGFYIFDYYGTFKNRLPFLHWTNIAVSQNKIFGISNNKLYSYQINTLVLKEYLLPGFFINPVEIKIINGNIYLLKEDGLYIYNVK